MNQYKDVLKDKEKLQLAYNNCKKFVDDENGKEDVTYEDVRVLIDYIADLEYNIACALEEIRLTQEATNSLKAAFKSFKEGLNKIVVKEDDKLDETDACPHGYVDWDECSVCNH